MVGYLPIGIERLVRTAVGQRALPRPVIPPLVVLLAALTIIPVGQAAVELIVRPVTVHELVDRSVGLATQLVAVDGYALLVPFDAEPPPDAAGSYVYHWYAVRDSLQDPDVVLVRSIIAPDALSTRSVVARVVDDPAAVKGARAGIVARGGPDPGQVASPLLIEEQPGGAGARDLGSLSELSEVSAGQIVRVTLRFDAGIASCVARGSCQARPLADGIGSWDNLATDPGGSGWVVVRTTYPPSVAPFHGVGHHAQDRELLERFLSQPVVRGMLGWGNVLELAHVEHDLGLPINHEWAGPILFTALAGLLLLGLRLGYPRFRVTRSRAPLDDARQVPTWAALPCRVTGRISPPNASPFEADDFAATVRAAARGGTELSLEVAGGRREVTIPRGLGGLGAIEIGELMTVSRVLPALKVSWFGNNVLLVFRERPARDAATAVIRRGEHSNA